MIHERRRRSRGGIWHRSRRTRSGVGTEVGPLGLAAEHCRGEHSAHSPRSHAGSAFSLRALTSSESHRAGPRHNVNRGGCVAHASYHDDHDGTERIVGWRPLGVLGGCFVVIFGA